MPGGTAGGAASSTALLGRRASPGRGTLVRMGRPTKLEAAAVDAWLGGHAGWERVGGDAIARKFAFPDFSAALGFVVRVGCWAEKHDHHPDVELSWGKARVLWSTHDAGGVTALDLQAAEAADEMAG
jgi:4a-hydroxytetrahydrobiopterin dehydratase